MSESLIIIDLPTIRIKLTDEQKKENAKIAMKKYYNNNKDKCHVYQRKYYDNLPEHKKQAKLENERVKTKKRIQNMDNGQYEQYLEYIREYNKTHTEQRKKISAKYWINKQLKKNNKIEDDQQIIEKDLTIDIND